jgi:hypothetical protein
MQTSHFSKDIITLVSFVSMIAENEQWFSILASFIKNASGLL